MMIAECMRRGMMVNAALFEVIRSKVWSTMVGDDDDGSGNCFMQETCSERLDTDADTAQCQDGQEKRQ